METQALTHESLTVPVSRLFRISLPFYERMISRGLFERDDKVMLLDGLLVRRASEEPPHVCSRGLTSEALRRLGLEGWIVWEKIPIALPAGPAGYDSLPPADLAVVRGQIRDYVARRPRPSDLAFVIEVADDTLAEDRAALVRYAWAGIPIAWIVNLNERAVEVHSRPTRSHSDARYLDTVLWGEGDEIPLAIEGCEVGRVAVNDRLP